MAEIQVFIDLTTPPGAPQVIPQSVGVPITGVIVNGTLPAGLSLRVGRNNSPAGIILGGAPAAGQGGDALTDFFCPPVNPEGLAVSWNVAAPGQFAELILVTASGGDVARA